MKLKYTIKEKVLGVRFMRNEIKLEKATEGNAKEIHTMQKIAFAELLKKYQDYTTNPGNDSLEKVISKLNREDTEYYFIKSEEYNVGVVHIKRIEPNVMNLKTLYVLPEYQGKGIAQKAMNLIEEIHSEVHEWRLDTILQEKGNCYLYEKLGYVRTGEIRNIKEGMDLVYYSKIIK